MFAAFPEVLNWDKVNRNFFYGDLSIQVVEAKPGMESGNKNVDYKIEFLVNGEKVVLLSLVIAATRSLTALHNYILNKEQLHG